MFFALYKNLISYRQMYSGQVCSGQVCDNFEFQLHVGILVFEGVIVIWGSETASATGEGTKEDT